MQVDGRSFGWQLTKRFPIPSPQQCIVFVADCKLPAIERDVRSRPGRQDRKVRGEVLSRRKVYAFIGPTAGKTSGDDAHIKFPLPNECCQAVRFVTRDQASV